MLSITPEYTLVLTIMPCLWRLYNKVLNINHRRRVSAAWASIVRKSLGSDWAFGDIINVFLTQALTYNHDLQHTQTKTEQHTRYQTSHDRGTEQEESRAGERKRRRNGNGEVVIAPCTKQTAQQEPNREWHCLAGGGGAWLTEPCCLLTSSDTKEKESDWWGPPLPTHTQKHEHSIFFFFWCCYHEQIASFSILPQFTAAQWQT